MKEDISNLHAWEAYDDLSSPVAARVAPIAVIGLGIASSALGLLLVASNGRFSGFSAWLLATCTVFSVGLLFSPVIRPRDRLAPLGLIATAYFAICFAACAVHAIIAQRNDQQLLASLIWFIPLQFFNQTFNEGRTARILAWILLATPPVILGLFSPQIAHWPAPQLQTVFIVFAMAHFSMALMVSTLRRGRTTISRGSRRSASRWFLFKALDSIPGSLFLVDRQFRLLYLNNSACAVLGVQRSKVDTMLLAQALPGFDSPLIAHALEEAWNADGPRQFEAQLDGAQNWYEIRCTPRRSDMSVYFYDITERRRSDQILRLEHTLARCLAEADDPTAALARIMREICECEDWDLGRYFRLDEAAGVMRYDGYWGREGADVERIVAASLDHSLRLGEGLVGTTWQTGEPIWCPDALSDERVKHVPNAHAVAMSAVFVFPVRSSGKIVGVLTFSSRRVREPDQRLLLAVSVIGGQIGQYLLRDQAERTLRRSEMRFRKLTELSSDWYWELDANLRFVEVSDSVSAAWGISGVEMLGRTRWELPGSTPSKEARSLIDAAVAARVGYRDLGYEVISPDGSWHYLQSSAEPIFDEIGCFAGYRGVGKDVTATKRAERLKEEFVATVSHEMRTPLTSIAGSLGLLVGNAAGKIPESTARLLTIAHANSERLIRLVNDILDIDRLEGGQVVYNFKLFDLQPLVAETIEASRGFARLYDPR